MILKKYSLLILVFVFPLLVISQETSVLFGKICDANNKPIEMVHISIPILGIGTVTNNEGWFELRVPSNKLLIVTISHIEFKTVEIAIQAKPNERFDLSRKLDTKYIEFESITVSEKRERMDNLVRLSPKLANIIPGTVGGIEAILKTMPGVTSNNELSSQYSVRGGNFDENLVYVNDIEVYRPFLVRSGQQEGLSFVNSDMVSSVLFSSGGFDAKYGDKMSSVLDIKYKEPTDFAASTSLSLLGGSAHIEWASDNHRLTYITGIRHKTSQYLLKTMDVQADYKPTFSDIQTYVTYDISEKVEIGFLGNFAQNRFKFIPQTRETAFGTVSEALKLKIYFDGQELDRFSTLFGALNTEIRPNKNISLKFITSIFNTAELEAFDIQGQYFLNELDKELGSNKLGDSIMNIGVGTYIDHTRNTMKANVYNITHKGNYVYKKHFLQWGTTYTHEVINDKINEWKMIDSAGYSIPYSDSLISLYYHTKSDIAMMSNRFSGFIQNTYSFKRDSATYNIVFGLRSNYWDFNNQLVGGPRIMLSYKPNWKHDVSFRVATGYYFQPPFYRELRDFIGNINYTIKAQKSIHFVLASEYYFTAWKRPFKYITEAYYKYLDNIIPYEIENVRIRYYAHNNAHGYVAGIDFNVTGEFVKGVDSWASISIMKTAEDIKGDYYYQYYNKDNKLIISGITEDDSVAYSKKVEPGFIPRPTDQRVNFNLFFQDYLPGFPTWKMQLNLVFGSSLPFGPPNGERYQATLRMPPYRRVDIGFSKVLKNENKSLSQTNPFHYFKSVWATAEVFNLLDINNTISYIWISDIRGKQYAVPNYLTSRRFNLKLIANF